jgi:glycosyltransferase involved in cell wall biosynthesis
MRIAFVPPRYGTEVIGGAENAVRMFAEHLVALGDEVEVFTTCAREATTWADEYPEGSSDIGGVGVHRFRSVSGRHPDFPAVSDDVLPQGRGAKDDRRWVDMQGPVCPAAIDAAVASTADAVVFYPYLYWPSVVGVGRLRDRAIFHPAAHDEPPLHLPIFETVFAQPRALVFQTEAERTLVRRLFEVEHVPQLLLGLGVEDPPGVPDPVAARAALGLGDRPYLLCVGRVDDGKGATILASSFARYKARHPGPLALVFAGQVIHAPPPHPDIVMAGQVDETLKWGLIAGAAVYVHPSPHEAFSIALMEAWSMERPIVVNAVCEATREHCARSGGGLWFSGYGDLEVILDRLLADPTLRERLGTAGKAYVDRLFLWPSLIRRYRGFLHRTLDGPNAPI